jgi:hypothetical protein
MVRLTVPIPLYPRVLPMAGLGFSALV